MGRAVLYQGSINLGKGILIMGCPTVIVNGRWCGRMGDLDTPHPFAPAAPKPKPIHPPNPVILGNFTVTVGGRPIARLGDIELLLHPYLLGSFNVVTG